MLDEEDVNMIFHNVRFFAVSRMRPPIEKTEITNEDMKLHVLSPLPENLKWWRHETFEAKRREQSGIWLNRFVHDNDQNWFQLSHVSTVCNWMSPRSEDTSRRPRGDLWSPRYHTRRGENKFQTMGEPARLYKPESTHAQKHDVVPRHRAKTTTSSWSAGQ